MTTFMGKPVRCYCYQCERQVDNYEISCIYDPRSGQDTYRVDATCHGRTAHTTISMEYLHDWRTHGLDLEMFLTNGSGTPVPAQPPQPDQGWLNALSGATLIGIDRASGPDVTAIGIIPPAPKKPATPQTGKRRKRIIEL